MKYDTQQPCIEPGCPMPSQMPESEYCVYHARRAPPAEAAPRPTKLLIDNDTLRTQIAADPDDEPSAGGYPKCDKCGGLRFPDGDCPSCDPERAPPAEAAPAPTLTDEQCHAIATPIERQRIGHVAFMHALIRAGYAAAIADPMSHAWKSGYLQAKEEERAPEAAPAQEDIVTRLRVIADSARSRPGVTGQICGMELMRIDCRGYEVGAIYDAADTIAQLRAQLAAMTLDRDNARALVRDICHEWNEACTCETLPMALGHGPDCPATEIAAAKRALRARAEKAEAALAAREAEIAELVHDNARLVQTNADLATQLAATQAELAAAREAHNALIEDCADLLLDNQPAQARLKNRLRRG